MPVFSELIGQNEIKARLKGFCELSSGHAFIFVGPKGIGRHSFAKKFASVLLCSGPADSRPCGKCRSCICLREGSHPDYKEILPDSKSGIVKTDTVRKALVGDIGMMPQLSEMKVYFIDADSLNEQGQNVILKTLEEPPEYAVIILSVVSASAILQTVRSRAVLLKFGLYSSDEMKAILNSHGYVSDRMTEFYSVLSGGIPGVALRMIGEEGYGELRRETIGVAEKIPSAAYDKIFLDVLPFFLENKLYVTDIIRFLTSWFRDAAVMAKDKGSKLIVNTDQRGKLIEYCERNGNHDLKYMRCVTICDRCAADLELNAAFEICIGTMLLRIRKELSVNA
ncbi:MAG: hypothetical protein PHN99_03440 [Eubacteriales bacterium]|nr:hypothetical protein [Eubacteriales bacterium]